MSSKKTSFELFHGTSSKNLKSIIENGFQINPDPQDWLGHGVYFFIEGISCPIKNALEWAINSAQNNQRDSLSVIKTRMTVLEEKILNLTTLEGLKKYQATRDFVIDKYKSELKFRRDLRVKKRKDFRTDDQIIMNFVIDILKADVVISHLYIKNNAQRALELESCFPNTTVASVINVEILDHPHTIEIYRHGVFEIT